MSYTEEKRGSSKKVNARRLNSKNVVSPHRRHDLGHIPVAYRVSNYLLQQICRLHFSAL